MTGWVCVITTSSVFDAKRGSASANELLIKETAMKKPIVAIFGHALFALLIAAPAHAARIVDTATVAQAMSRGAILWDIREAEAYSKGHIPGALNLGTRVCSQLRTPVSWDYIPIERITSRLGAWGIDPGKEIIAYADKGSACPYFILVSLELVGAKNVHVYHGGIDDWKAAGRPLATTATTLPPITLDLHPQPGVIVSTDEVKASLTDPKVQFLDVRTPDEFVGLDVRALRGGHIPHAVNIPYEQNWIDPESLIKVAKKQLANNDGFALKSREELKQVYAKLNPALKTIVYCQSSPRASVTATVLKDLGFRDVRVYDASWAGYGNRFELPAENETYFDMFALTNRIGTLQKRVDTLEKQLDEMKAVRK
jgi:thiosulfate/3-mercaptopyruvate sulfurtransferase